ncbi:hypothetical protein ACH0CA_01345 [Kytococcus sedentarius]|uniref:hypothetical protein n=1 Tax=Kytococcus sedentarius TaxID=1276 RepID=UPI00387A0B59
MTDTTNPRAEFDKALAAMRHTKRDDSTVRVTLATVACAEALALLVDAHLPQPEPEPEPDPRESLPDGTPVGHGWVVSWSAGRLHKPGGLGRFTRWLAATDDWGAEGFWRESDLADPRPATVGDLRRVGVPAAEWPDITAPEPTPEPEPEPPVGSVVLDRDGIAWQQVYEGWESAPYALTLQWADLHRKHGTPTVIHRAEP